MTDYEVLQVYVTKAMNRIEDLYLQTHGACYLSFSGGRDSTIVLAIIKLCEERGIIPKNSIPAVFCDTKIELGATVEFVKWVQKFFYENVQIIETEMLFPQVLKKYGKPVRSKIKSRAINEYMNKRDTKMPLYLYDDNYSKSNRVRLANKDFHFLHENFDIPVSNECCNQMKKIPFKRYAKENRIEGYYTGMRMDEGGVRAIAYEKKAKYEKAPCTTIKDGLTLKNPIIDWSDNICEMFIKEYNVPLSKAYTVYGLRRTGCFCCPYAKDLYNNLENLHKNEPNRYKAALFYLKDVYIAQGVQLKFDSAYMKEYTEKWKCYEIMRYEMLKKYRSNCRLVKKYEKENENGRF